jgi:N-acetyl-anhydromuramyl-L-alanine amidase AmpD
MEIIEPNYSWAYQLTPRSTTTHLILHHLGAESASAESIHRYHMSKGWAGIGYHYYVTKKGEIFRGRPEAMRGAHTSDWNYCSIGVCFEGNFENEFMNAEQLKAGRELIADINSRYGSIVKGCHRQYGQTACPGANFPFDALVSCSIPPEPTVDEPDNWAKDACEQAIGDGLFLGDGNDCFRWHDSVTRQELAVILMRYRKVRN